MLTYISTPVATQTNKDDLAKVAILPYNDNTGTKNFGYLPNSLREAIDTSLRKKFEYIPVDPNNAERVAREASQKKFKNSNAYDDAVLLGIPADILIAGDFTYDPQQNVLLIRTRIRVLDLKETLLLPELRNKVDDTIFDATEKVATLVVQELTALAQRSQDRQNQKSSETKGGDNKEENLKNEKIALTRESTPSLVFAPQAILVAVGTGLAFGHEALEMPAGFSLEYRQAFTPQWFAGAHLRLTSFMVSEKFQKDHDGGFEATLNSLSLEAGYYWYPTKRLRFPFSFFGGYYWGNTAVSPGGAGGGDFRRNISNPTFGFSAGTEYLLLQNLSLGLRLGSYIYFDQNLAGDISYLGSLDPQLTVSYVF